MRYSIPSNFDVGTLLTATSLGGVTLSQEDGGPAPDGYIIRDGDGLDVILEPENVAKRAVIDTAVSDQGGSRA